jgi:hypothetical protein
MRRLWITAVLALAAAAPLQAQGFLMNSAETIDKGNFKVAAFPILLFGKNGADNEIGFGARAGFGLTSRFDVEAFASLFDGAKQFGADAELWLVKGGGLDASVTAGAHRLDGEGGFDLTGFDGAATLGTHLGSKFEPYVGLKLSFESVAHGGGDFTRLHVVPGFEYRLSKNLDIVAELGLGLNDDSTSYASAGLALYLR